MAGAPHTRLALQAAAPTRGRFAVFCPAPVGLRPPLCPLVAGGFARPGPRIPVRLEPWCCTGPVPQPQRVAQRGGTTLGVVFSALSPFSQIVYERQGGVSVPSLGPVSGWLRGPGRDCAPHLGLLRFWCVGM